MKSSEELASRLDSKINELAATKKTLQSADIGKYKPADTEVITRSGKVEMKDNHVVNAFEDMTSASNFNKLSPELRARVTSLYGKFTKT